MNRGARQRAQRERRQRLKVDAATLLDRIVAGHGDRMTTFERAEISEMRMRLQPPCGVAAPIVFTDYSATQPPRSLCTIVIETEEYATAGYGDTGIPQRKAQIILLSPGRPRTTLQVFDSGSPFAAYGADKILPAAREYAQKAAHAINAYIMEDPKNGR